jgi:pectate lyase
MTLCPRKFLGLSCVLGLFLAACDSGGDGTTGTGGAGAGTGGRDGVGGMTAGAGGKTGPVTGTGGKTGGGGATGTGGRGTGGAPGAGGGNGNGTGGAATGGGGTTGTDQLIGWAAQGCTVSGVSTTTGGGTGAPMVVTSLSALNSAAAGTAARVIQFSGNLSGSVTVGSNKTIIGTAGATITGHIEVDRSANVILKNFTVVGLNCSDVPSNGDCQDGADAITINNGAHHIWVDHLDVSDGSDGNMDITNASDCVTVSWTKFHYSTSRVAGYTGEVHHFSNLIGGDDASTGDTGHLRVTWHHDWWADHVVERQPRVRFGQNHIFNNLWTSTGNNYCVAAAVSSNVLVESNVFDMVRDTVDTTNYSNAATIAVARNNMYVNGATMTADKGTAVFTPPYTYPLEPTAAIEAEIKTGAGPH